MSTQRYISTSFWTDKWIRTLDPSERYLYMYLLTNPLTNISGIYKITIDRIAFDTGYDERTLIPMLERFKTSGKAAFIFDEWIILPSWPKHQRWETKSKIKSGIDTILRETPKKVLEYAKNIGYLYPMDTISIPYAYEPNYSDLNSDSDIDTDRDSDTPASPTSENPPPSPPPSFQNRTIPTDTSKDASARIDRLRIAWNYAGLPECRYTVLNFRDYERADCMRAVSFYTDAEIEKAIQNYAGILKSTAHEIFPYKGFTSFMGKGVEQFIDKADPWTVKKRRATEGEKKKADEYKDRGGFEVPEKTCPCCGNTWKSTMSTCPKCSYESGDILEHREWYFGRTGERIGE